MAAVYRDVSVSKRARMEVWKANVRSRTEPESNPEMTLQHAAKPYAFVLVPGYSQLGFACAIEALSLANRHPGADPYYRWRLLSEDGVPVPAYNGVVTQVDGPLVALNRSETIVICAGEDVGKSASKTLINWLRREVRRGMDFGALSSGTYILARAGLLAGKRVTTHWEYRAALTEILPDVIMEDTIFSIDGRVFTTAGGAASMDMMLERIRADYGVDLAKWVADQMVYTDPRLPDHAQRMSLQTHTQVRNGKLALAMQIMENNIEDPLTPDEISAIVEISTRQLERLFAKYVGLSPKRHYLRLRLEKARDLLRQTDLSVTDVCVACGFKSLSHFSKSYRAAYGISPGVDGSSNSKLIWHGGI